MALKLYSDTDIQNIANAIRTKNGSSDTYKVSEMASAIQNIPSGGGGALSLIDTITIPEDVRAFNLDLTKYAYSDYDMAFAIADITLSGSDWLYYAANGSSTSGGSYTNAMTNHNGVIWARMYIPALNTRGEGYVSNSPGVNITTRQTIDNLYMYTYDASKVIRAGSTIKIYGGNYADLR